MPKSRKRSFGITRKVNTRPRYAVLIPPPPPAPFRLANVFILRPLYIRQRKHGRSRKQIRQFFTLQPYLSTQVLPPPPVIQGVQSYISRQLSSRVYRM